jgi:hypothetical protein
MVKNQPTELQFGFHQASPVRHPKLNPSIKSRNIVPNFKDAAAQRQNQPATIPTLEAQWLGVGIGFFGYSVPDAPTDANLSIGDTQIVQWVNVQFAVFDLNGNNILFNGQHYVNGNVLFTGLPHCGAHNYGDIIAQWDKMAHRWVMFYNVGGSGPYFECFAISQTPDATGAYYTYEFPTLNNSTDYPDYPKVGVWPNGYYVSHNDFPNLQNYAGAMPCAYDRVKMLAGDPSALGVCFLDNSNNTLFDDSMLPADVDDANAPPTGLDPIFVGSVDNGPNGVDSNVYYYHFHFDPVNPSNSTFDCINGACAIPVTQYQIACQNIAQGICEASQPVGVVDNLADRLMYRLAYRILPSPTPQKTVRDNRKQDWIVSHTVFNGSQNAVRWYEFQAPIDNTTPTVHQQGTYTPDNTTDRFMSSLARDNAGNIAMSYTASSTSLNPTIAYTGRSGSDPLGTMGPEAIIITGAGYQTDTSNRWGDYYDMALSNDGCTMVTNGQFYMSNASFHWSTQIGKLKFDSCIPQ